MVVYCELFGVPQPYLVAPTILFSSITALLAEVFVSYVSAPLLRLVDSDFDRRGAEQQRLWGGRLVSTIHACVAFSGAVYTTFLDPQILANPVGGHSIAWKLIGSFSAAYFLWDLSECLRYPALYGREYVFHACVCIAAYATSAWFNTFPWLGSFGLLYEASTPFVNLRQTLISLKRTNSRLFRMTEMTFFLLFFFVRICGGAYFLFYGLQMVLAEHCVALPHRLVAGMTVLSSSALNTFWFIQIVRRVIKNLTTKKKD